MSYVRTYTERLSGSVTVEIDYPASERGGTRSATEYWSEDVEVEIVVDTRPFDSSVGSVKGHVDLLTGTVVAAGGAQVIAKGQASKQVSEALVGGFFSLIGSELEQQMMRIKAYLPPKLQELRALAARCAGVREQMEADFRRITERYTRLFGELDQELERRVSALDRASFQLVGAFALGGEAQRHGRAALVPALSAQEQESARASLVLGALKADAGQLIHGSHRRTQESRALAQSLRDMLAPEQAEGQRLQCVPVAAAVHDDLALARPTRSLYQPDGLALPDGDAWGDAAESGAGWGSSSPEERARVVEYLDRRLERWLGEAEDKETSPRVAAEMRRLWAQWRAQ